MTFDIEEGSMYTFKWIFLDERKNWIKIFQVTIVLILPDFPNSFMAESRFSYIYLQNKSWNTLKKEHGNLLPELTNRQHNIRDLLTVNPIHPLC